MDSQDHLYFELFNEIGIIAQLSRTVMEKRLPAGITLPHFSVVSHLVRLGDGVTPAHLADAFQVPRNSMTNTLAGLERRGYIEVRPNPADARSRLVYLTKAGAAFREAAIEAVSGDIGWLAGRFPENEVESLLPKLAQLRELLDANRDIGSGD